jgi:predicted permease
MLHEIRIAVRSLLRTPAFTAVAVLSLALGIGLNTTIFSAVNGLLLRPLPVAEPDRVVGIFTSDYSGPLYGGSSWADYADLRDNARSFELLAGVALQPVGLGTGEGSVVTIAQVVSGNFFTLVGQSPLRGRLLQPGDDRPDAPAAAVISEPLWRARFGADEAVIGRDLAIAGHRFVVVGVAPEGFTGTQRGIRTDLWLPAATLPLIRPGGGGEDLVSRGARGITIFGVLRPGVPEMVAQAELHTLAAGLRASYPDYWSDVRGEGRRLTLVPEAGLRLPPQLRGGAMGASALLLVLTALVLLVACANLANLLLARAARRRREIAVRIALGAGRRRLVRQLLGESLLLAVAGGALGLLLALWGADLIASLQPPIAVPLALDFSPDARVVAFAAGLALVTGLLMGIAPALQASRPDLVTSLRDGGTDTGRSRLRGAFVVAQVAVSLVLLVAAGLFMRSLQQASTIEPGFTTRNALLATVDLSLAGYSEERGTTLFDGMLERVRALPGVEAASYTTHVPLSLNSARRSLSVRGYEPGPGEEMEFGVAMVGPGYFETMGVPLVRGRGITGEDRAGAPGVVVVNEAFARRFWPGEDPIGREVGLAGDQGPWSTVVGIARDGKYGSRSEEPSPFYYVPYAQEPRSAVTLIVRTAGNPRDLVAPVRGAVRETDPALAVAESMTLTESLELSLLPQRAGGLLLTGFGLLGLVLASMGIYGVIAYTVAQRTREVGIRMALGASSVSVVGLVVRYAARLVLIGVVIGLVAAFALARLVRGFLTGLDPSDPLTYGGVVAVLCGVALLAAWLPARRAARVDPMVALRQE